MCVMNRTFCFLTLFIVLSFKTKDFKCNAMNSVYENETVIDRYNKVLTLKQIDYNLWKLVPPILYVVGTIGNMLTIAVLRR